MLPQYYEFYNPVKIVAGNKALENIPFELSRLYAKRPIIITDKGIVKAGLLKIVIKAFRDSDIVIGAIYDDTPRDSSIDVVNEIPRIYRGNQCDSLIAVGGGSVIDTAKGANIVISEETDDIAKFMGAERLAKPQRPLIVVPTSVGTGSEVTWVAVIYDPAENVKMAFASSFLFPKVAVLDPRMTSSLPPNLTAATGMDALAHAVEAYSCLQKNPLSDAYAISAIRLINENLVKAVENGKDKDARFAMANAAVMAGAAFSNSMVGAVHGIGHACGGVAHIPHGVAMAILLPVVMEYNLSKLNHYYAELLLPLAGDEVFAATDASDRARKSIETVRNLNATLNRLCGLPVSLKEAGVDENQLEEIAKTAIGDGSLIFNPEEVEFEDALRILREAHQVGSNYV
jgi:alcohol dehydrogenase